MSGRRAQCCLRCRRYKLRCGREKPECLRCKTAMASCEYGPAATSAALPEPRAHRNRAILSCLRCREHKVRCDRKTPCGRCVKNRQESCCVYAEAEAAHSSAKLPPSEHTLTLDLIATGFLDAKRQVELRGGGHWHVLLNEMKRHLPVGFGEYSGAEVNTEGLAPKMTPSINYPLGTDVPSDESFTHIVADLPRRTEQHEMLSAYMSTVNTVYQLVDPHEFHAEVHCFWANQKCQDAGWLAQYLMTLCLGCQALNHEAEAGLISQAVRGNLPISLLRAAEMCLKRTPYLLIASQANLRTLILMVISKQVYTMSCHEEDTCWPLTGLIIRLGIRSGVNRLETGGLSRHDAMTRERVWTAAVVLEMRQSLACGMPLLLRFSDTRAGGDMGPDSLFVALLQATRQLLFKAVELATCEDDGVSYDQVVAIDSAMREHLRMTTTAVFDHFGTSEAADLESCAVQIFFRQILMALHSRFALQPTAFTEYPVSYLSSLESALAVIAHQRNLCEGEKHGHRRAWFAGFFRNEFFTAAMTVCYHLVKNSTQGTLGRLLNDAKATHTKQQQVMIEALRSCRNVWGQERHSSPCGASAYFVVDTLVKILGNN